MSTLEKNIGYSFQNKELLQKAITHPSALAPGQGVDFERLEFLGDRVLGLIVADWIFEKYPGEPEGTLAKRFTNLVRKEALVHVAQNIHFDHSLIMKHEKSSSTLKRLETLMADGCEALIGAIYLDGGLSSAQSFIQTYWEDLLKDISEPPKDPKCTLQEWAQSQGKHHPSYVVLESSGPAHSPVFMVEVHVEGHDPVKGEGSSKKQAEKKAAQHFLNKILAS